MVINFKSETLGEEIARRGKWKRVFAWTPVWPDLNTLVWFSFVWVREEPVSVHNVHSHGWRTRYSLINPSQANP